MKKNNKELILLLSIILVIGVIGTIWFYKKKGNNIEKEIAEVVNTLNDGNGNLGDWSRNLYITKVNKASKIDIKLLDDEAREYVDEKSKIFIINLEERTYGTVEIVVVNGEVTANSILGDYATELWRDTTNDKVDVNKINKLIKYKKNTNSFDEVSEQEINVRLDDNLTQKQIEETIENIKMLQYVSRVQNSGEGIIIVDLTDLAKYEYVKSEIVKIDGVKNVE